MLLCYHFFIFHSAFAFLLFPARDTIHFLLSTMESGSGTASINLLIYWLYLLYFIIIEVYAGAGVPLLFW